MGDEEDAEQGLGTAAQGENEGKLEVEEGAEEDEGTKLQGKALGCLAPESGLRTMCLALFENRIFGGIVLVCIAANTVLLALQGPRHTYGKGFDDFVTAFDIFIMVIFTVEMLAGIFALGFVKGKGTYLKDPWNTLDFTVVMGIYLAALAMLLVGTDIEAGAIRAFRALRPLRSLRLFKGLQSIMDALWMTLPYVTTIVGMLAFFLVIFSTMGVALFGGALTRACPSTPVFGTLPHTTIAASESDYAANHTWEVARCPTNFACEDPRLFDGAKQDKTVASDMCTVIPFDLSPDHSERFLENRFAGFDDIMDSLLTLTVVTSLDEWPMVSHRLWASDNIAGIGAWCFLTCVVMLLSLISANLFVAVVSYGFQKARLESNASAFSGEDWGRLKDAVNSEDDRDLAEYEKMTLEEFVELKPFPFTCLSKSCFPLVRSQGFEYAVLGLIILNALAMATEYKGMEDWHQNALLAIEWFFLCCFTIEMLLKWTGMGLKYYLQDSMNVFDGTLVVVSWLGAVVDYLMGAFLSARVVRILFRMFRAARVLRLAGQEGAVNRLLKALFHSWPAISNLLLFTTFTLVVYAIIGMHTFGYTCHADQAPADIPRTGFADFPSAFLACFQVMSMEDWAPIMYYYMHCADPFGAALFFSSLMMTCGYVLLSMFVAVILENFALAEDHKEKKQEEAMKAKAALEAREIEMAKLSTWRWGFRAIAESSYFDHVVLVAILISSFLMGLDYPAQKTLTAEEQKTQDTLEYLGFAFFAFFFGEFVIKLIGFGFITYIKDPWNRLDFSVVVFGVIDIVVLIVYGQQNSLTRILRLFRVLRPLRSIKQNQGMVVVVNALINCIPMVSGVVGLVALLYIVFAIVGLNMYMGMLMKCAPVDGVIIASMGPYPGYNTSVAGAITVEGMATMATFATADTNTTKFQWNLTTFDPAGGGIHVHTGYSCDDAKAVGGHLHKMPADPWGASKYTNCSDCNVELDTGLTFKDVQGRAVVVHDSKGVRIGCGVLAPQDEDEYIAYGEVECAAALGSWEDYFHSTKFDNIFDSFKTLFVVTTTEGWIDVLHTVQDTPDKAGEALSEKNSAFSGAVYCVSIIVFGAFFSANLFVGVLVEFFGYSSGTSLLTANQKQWVQLTMLSASLAPDHPAPPPPTDAWYNALRIICFKIADSSMTEAVVGFAIILNTTILMLEHFPMSKEFQQFMEIANIVFLLIFTAESGIKIFGIGPGQYFTISAWNRLDFTIVIISWLSLAAEGLSVFSGARALRVFRVLLLLKNTESLQTLLRTLVLSLPAAFNITTLLMLVLFVFGIVGMQLFGGLPHGVVNVDTIHEYDNFDTITASMRVLWQVATGQDWVTKAEELAIKMKEAEYFGAELVIPYLAVYYIASVYIFVNLFIAVLLESFELNFDPDTCAVKTDDLHKYKAAWEQLDGHTHMPVNKIKTLVEVGDLGVLTQVMEDKNWWPALKLNMGLDIEKEVKDDDVVGFKTVLMSLALMYVHLDALPVEERIEQARMLKSQARRTSGRLIHCLLVARRHLKHPEKYCNKMLRARHNKMNDEDFYRRYKICVTFVRDMMIAQICHCSKINTDRSDDHLLALLELQGKTPRGSRKSDAGGLEFVNPVGGEDEEDEEKPSDEGIDLE